MSPLLTSLTGRIICDIPVYEYTSSGDNVLCLLTNVFWTLLLISWLLLFAAPDLGTGLDDSAFTVAPVVLFVVLLLLVVLFAANSLLVVFD